MRKQIAIAGSSAFATASSRSLFRSTTFASKLCKHTSHRLSRSSTTKAISETAQTSEPKPMPISAETPTTQPPRRLRKGDNIDLKIAKIAYGGGAMGYIEASHHVAPEDVGMPVYAPKGACPGDVIRCSIKRVRRRKQDANRTIRQSLSNAELAAGGSRSYAEALFVKRVAVSPQAIPAPCVHFGNGRLGGGGCGGCTSMHMTYEHQLEQKQDQVEVMFAKIADRDGVEVDAIIPCEDTVHYRNKMEFSWGRRWFEKPITPEEVAALPRRAQEYALGLHVPQRFDKIVHISECHIQQPVGNEILEFVRQRTVELLLEPYDNVANTGYLRNIALRTATNKEGNLEVMVNFITSPCEVPDRLVPLANDILEKFPSVVCVLQNMRMERASVLVEKDKERLLGGSRRYIEQSLCGLTFRISANSFFQTNSEQAEVLYEEVRKAAKLSPTDSVLDLFCGTGTIGLSLASHCEHVYGVDIVQAAIDDACMNASNNGIVNATFEQGNLDKLNDKPEWSGFSCPDVIIVDPPRAGLQISLLKYLRDTEAKRIVYVSCNPASQVRDILYLQDLAPNKFRVSEIQPLDMFPNTHHLECIVTIERV